MNAAPVHEAQIGKEATLTKEVLNYLLTHPEAQDTLEGIAEWWVLKQRIAEVVGNLEPVLNDLVKRDFLLVTRCGEDRLRYRLNRQREREVRRYLRNSKSAAPTLATGRV